MGFPRGSPGAEVCWSLPVSLDFKLSRLEQILQNLCKSVSCLLQNVLIDTFFLKRERGENVISKDKMTIAWTLWQVKQRYLEVGRTMKDYEDQKYEQWKETTEQVLPALMKKSLLTKVPISRFSPRWWQLCGMMVSVIFLRFDLLTLMKLIGNSKIKGEEGQRLGRKGDAERNEMETA